MPGQELGIESFYADLASARANNAVILSGMGAPKLAQRYVTHAASELLASALETGDTGTAAEIQQGMAVYIDRYGNVPPQEVPTVIYWPDQP